MKNYIAVLLLFVTSIVFGQDQTATATPSDWISKMNVGANFSQVGLSNWAGGGESSLALTGLMTYSLIYTKDIWKWENTADIAYGIIQQGDKATRKSDDKIILNSKLGRNFAENWSFTGLLEFRSQFAEGFKYSVVNNVETATFVSKFMSPAYLTASIGIEYKPNDQLSLYVTPITGKTTFVLSDTLSKQGAYGVTPGENVLNQFGILSVAEFKTPIMTNINFTTKLTLFDDYKKLSLIDVNWETLFLFTINEYINASFATNLIYDDDIIITRANGTTGKDVQVKEVIALGILYTF